MVRVAVAAPSAQNLRSCAEDDPHLLGDGRAAPLPIESQRPGNTGDPRLLEDATLQIEEATGDPLRPTGDAGGDAPPPHRRLLSQGTRCSLTRAMTAAPLPLKARPTTSPLEKTRFRAPRDER